MTEFSNQGQGQEGNRTKSKAVPKRNLGLGATIRERGRKALEVPKRQRNTEPEKRDLPEHESFVVIEGEDITADLLGDVPHLIDVKNTILEERQIREPEIAGVMFNLRYDGAVAGFRPHREAGDTFISLSHKGSTSAGDIEAARSTYTVLDHDRGFIQRKPCGIRTGELPFALSVPFKDFTTRTGYFDNDTDLAALYLEEFRSGDRGPVTQHISGSWEVNYGMLSSEARREMMNGLRFAQLYHQAYGEYPTGQIPLAVKKLTEIALPDGSKKSVNESLKTRLEGKPLEYSMMKTRLLFYEQQRNEALEKDKGETESAMVGLKAELDAASMDEVIGRFLDDDPFVQVAYYTPSYVRLSYIAILADIENYNVIKEISDGKKARPQDILSTGKALYTTILTELCQTSGLTPDQLHFPEMQPHIALLNRMPFRRTLFGRWIKKVWEDNREVLDEITNIEIDKMAKTKAVVNSVGAVLYASVWNNNMIGGSPCDFDWFSSGYMDYLPQPDQHINFDKETLLKKLGIEGAYIDDNLSIFSNLLGSDPTSMKERYAHAFMTHFAKARQKCVIDDSSDLDPQYRQSLLSDFPQPSYNRQALGGISFN